MMVSIWLVILAFDDFTFMFSLNIIFISCIHIWDMHLRLVLVYLLLICLCGICFSNFNYGLTFIDCSGLGGLMYTVHGLIMFSGTKVLL